MATLDIILNHILLVIVNLFRLYLVLILVFDIRHYFGLILEDLQTAGRNILRYFNHSGRIIE